MTTSSHDLLVYATESGALAKPDVATAGIAGRARSRPGDDLLRQLPVDPFAFPAPASQVDAFRRVSMAGSGEPGASIRTREDSILVSAFAALLARLAGREVVELRLCSHQPQMLVIPLDPATSFASVAHAAATASAAANDTVAAQTFDDQAAAIEFVFSGQASLAALPADALRLSAQTVEGGYGLHLASSTGLWSQRLLELWLAYLDSLLQAAIAQPEAPWITLPLLEPAATRAFYRELNHTAAELDGVCVHDLVRRQVKRSPGAVAVATPERQITYLELDQRSDAVAERLLAMGAGANRPVAVYLERSVDLPVALLGVLKAGSSFVPLDTQDAPARVSRILAQSGAVAVIAGSSSSAPAEAGSIPVLAMAEQASIPAANAGTVATTPSQQAYVIYTSGTTGAPKGVPILHSGLVNFLQSMQRAPGFSPGDRLLALAPVSFDAASMEIFLPLIAGGTVVVADRHAAGDPARLAALLEQFDITFLQATPVTWRLLVSSGWEGKPNLTMTCGGEALPRDLANQLKGKGKELWNLYGPTETTICSSKIRIESESGPVPLGPPIENTTFYVLDRAGALLPPGVPGELYIGGAGVSPGYLEAPQGVARFVPDPFAGSSGARMFRSGDMVRLLHGNQLEFFGRLDHQVKLRGYRIELGEIESALRSFSAVNDAVAALVNDGEREPYLVACITAQEPQIDWKALRGHLSRWLPAYMLPAKYVCMDAFPLTGSGKVDRKAVIAFAASARHAGLQPEGVPPANELETQLLTIFREVLVVPDFGVTDSFFDFGGYSLLTVKLFARIRRTLKLRLPVSLLFDAATVRSLASFIRRSAPAPPLVEIRSRGTCTPLFVIHSYLLYEVFREVVEPHRPVYGLRESPDIAPETVEDSAAAYVSEMVKVCPAGPFLLTGWCAASSLTLEVARQLRRNNHRVGLVALLDAEGPGYRPRLRGERFTLLAARIRFHWRRLRGSSVREKAGYLGDFFRRGWERAMEKFFVHHRPWARGLERLFGPFLPRPVFDNVWSRIGALQHESTPSYSGKVVLFRAADVPEPRGADDTLGWRDIAKGGVEVVFVPGDHESMFRKPNLQFLSERFRQALQLGEL